MFLTCISHAYTCLSHVPHACTCLSHACNMFLTCIRMSLTLIKSLFVFLNLHVSVSLWFCSAPVDHLGAAAIYSLLGVWLLNTFPKSFTMGEAMIVAQGLAILFLDTVMQLLTLVSGKYKYVHVRTSDKRMRYTSLSTDPK